MITLRMAPVSLGLTPVLVVTGSRPGSRSRQSTPAAENGTVSRRNSGSGGRARSKGPSQERTAERKPLKVTLKTGGTRNGASMLPAATGIASGQKRQRKMQD